MKPSEGLDQEPREENKPNVTRFVEELAGENDYWMSLTDAARITRTSEPMVRRWVTSGRLPVRKEPAGINQRTRLVRASDVALIRPIIDPTAAITDDIHKLDLLSIPRQQEQIMHDQQRVLHMMQEMQQQITNHVQQTRITFEQESLALQQRVQEWNRCFAVQQTEWQEAFHKQQQRYDEIAIQVASQVQELQHHTRELKEQGIQQQQAIVGITDQLEHGHAVLQKALQEGQRHLEKLDQDVHHQLDQLSDDFAIRLTQQEKHSQNLFGKIEETLADHDNAHQQIQQNLVEVQQQFLTLQETLLADIKLQRSEIDDVFELRWSELLHERTEQYEYMKSIALRLTSVEIQDQERNKDQERQFRLLTTMLHDERADRQLLAEQLAQQQEQLQSLRRECEARFSPS